MSCKQRKFVSHSGLWITAIFLMGLSVIGFVGSTPAQAVDPVDLTGETCLSGSTIIDPDGPGSLPSFTYCLMIGNLGTGKALEMDDIGNTPPVQGNASSVADANLTAGTTANDPDLPCLSPGVLDLTTFQCVGGPTYIDWADLNILRLTGAGAAPLGSVENHRILDWTANGDFTMFKPQNASCLNSGSVLPKEDFTESFIGNNDQYLYFGQERRTNNGNSVYYWVLSKKPPIVASSPDCGNSTRGQVQFDLSANDVELIVNFPSSSDPAGGGVFFRLFTGADTGYIPATEAVFNAGWGFQLNPVVNFALNLAEAPNNGDDSFGPWGGIGSNGDPAGTGTYTTASLAEWAVDLLPVFGGGGLCGEKLFITGMSRSSTGQIGSLTESSALKDLIGPKLYSFGNIAAAASLVPLPCGDGFTYGASAVDSEGNSLPNATFSWSCTADDGHTVTLDFPTQASGTGSVPRNADGTPHVVTCTVTVTDPASGCSDDAEVSDTIQASLDAVLINPPPEQTLACTVPSNPAFSPDNGTTDNGIFIAPVVTGGSGNYQRTWTLFGTSATCPLNALSCTVQIPDNESCATVVVKLRVDDLGPPVGCAPRDFEFGFVRKATIIKFENIPPGPAPVCQ